jgi:HD-GYP domain-containing protein (c-di-GMP phosphodiesterase class II)
LDNWTNTVLVVSQDEAVRQTFAEALDHGRFEFVNAATGGDALSRLEEDDEIRLMVVDLSDAAVEGRALLDFVRGSDTFDDLPVVVMLDRAALAMAGKHLEAGADFFLLKPLDMAQTASRIIAALNQRQQRAHVRRQLDHFKILTDVGIALSAERNTRRLMERILLHAKDIGHADGGTLYMVSDNGQKLRFEIMRTDSLDFALGGTTGNEIPFPPLPMFHPDTKEPNHRNIATHVGVTGESVNIPDAYQAEGFDFSGTRAFDQKTGYRSQSFLTIPMKDNLGEVIGVLQLLNAIDRRSGEVVAFSAEVQEIIESLASQAAVAIDNQLLLQGQRELLDSFIKLIAAAIDAKSPYTGGHCARVPVLTEMLAEAACESRAPAFRDFDLDEGQRDELLTAAWLHDCGKVTTPEHVVDKATKLETIHDRLDLVRTRAEILKRDAEIELLKAVGAVGEGGADSERLYQELDQAIAGIDDDMAFIAMCNVGTESLSDEAVARIERIAGRTWRGPNGEPRPFLSEDEVQNLSVRRGTLTGEERKVINHHIVMTIEMLDKLPFPKTLKNVPEYAGGHHERMDGKGYPKGLKRHEMSIPARIMAVADVFEALTARDRPYKSAMKLSEAMAILGQMKLDNHIDPDLFDLFVEREIYLDYAEQFLLPEQIDAVNVADYLGPMPTAPQDESLGRAFRKTA